MSITSKAPGYNDIKASAEAAGETLTPSEIRKRRDEGRVMISVENRAKANTTAREATTDVLYFARELIERTRGAEGDPASECAQAFATMDAAREAYFLTGGTDPWALPPVVEVSEILGETP